MPENTPAIVPPKDEVTSSSIRLREDTDSDAPAVKIEKSHNAMVQNIALGVLLTAAFVLDNVIGSKTFLVWMYITSMMAGFGIVNWLPQAFGKPPGSVGGLALMGATAKYFGAALVHAAVKQGPWTGALLLAFVLTGCAGMEQRVADARDDADEARRAEDAKP